MPITSDIAQVIKVHRTSVNAMVPLINHVRKGTEAGRFSIKSLQLNLRAGFIQPRYAPTFLTHDLYQVRGGFRFIYFKGGKNLYVAGANVVQQGDQVTIKEEEINYNGYLIWHTRLSESFGMNAGFICSENNPGFPCMPLLGFFVKKYPFTLNAFFPRSIATLVQMGDKVAFVLDAQFTGFNINLHNENYRQEQFYDTRFLHRQLSISAGTEITIAKGRVVTPMIGYVMLQRVKFDRSVSEEDYKLHNNIQFSLVIALGKRYQSESTDAYKFLRSFGVGHRSFLNTID